MSFESLGLKAELLRAVAEKGYSQATPVQAQSIPHILRGRDILAGAQTGTGKTAGFTLPLLQRLSETSAPRKGKFQPIRALILAPTRELAIQVSESVRDYGKYLRVGSAVIFGGVKSAGQIFKLRRGPAILIATPGRLIDLVNQGEVDLSQVEILVLDEADRMLDMGFLPDIKRILAKLPEQRQNLLFSATYSDSIRKLAHGILKNPEHIEVATRNTTAAKVKQVVYPVNKDRKRQLLAYLLSFNNWLPALVFVRTKHGADRLAKQLIADGLRVGAIHGDKNQGARNKVLADFKEGRIKVLVATDVVARGLDINDLPHVVNFDLPMVAEDYVHRIGRTARAGKAGQAISLVDKDESDLLFAIEQLIQQKLPRQSAEGFEADFTLTTSKASQAKKPGGPAKARARNTNAANNPHANRPARRGDGHSVSSRPGGSRDKRGAEQRPRVDGRSSEAPRKPRGATQASAAGVNARGIDDDNRGNRIGYEPRATSHSPRARHSDAGRAPGSYQARSGSGQARDGHRANSSRTDSHRTDSPRTGSHRADSFRTDSYRTDKLSNTQERSGRGQSQRGQNQGQTANQARGQNKGGARSPTRRSAPRFA